MPKVEPFEKHVDRFEDWFVRNRFAYESELQAVRSLLPKNGNGVEIGVGTGRFAARLGIRVGVEPAKAMAAIARKRGIEVYEAKAERLPFGSGSFDFVLLVTTLCFLQNPMQALKEATRVLKSDGCIIIGIIDKDSPLGKIYEAKKDESKFYEHARFYSIDQVLEWLQRLKYGNIRISQTIFKNPKEITSLEPIKDGYGDGIFVVIYAQKEMNR